jgi:uncharacterized protein
MATREITFMRAHFKYLAMLNYEVDPAILAHRVPHGTELHAFGGKTLVSVVAFLSLKTRILGIPIPWHRDFEQINLRFYVRRKAGEGWRHGVVFIKNIVPRLAIALGTRALYRENYVAMPTRHAIDMAADARPSRVCYEWRFEGAWNRVVVHPVGELIPLPPGSEEEYTAEHYWGYSARDERTTSEYRVSHPPWKMWRVRDTELRCDVAGLYGPEFVSYLRGEPSSALLAEGSPASALTGQRLS